MNRMQQALKAIFDNAEILREELKPYDGIMKASGGKPLAECGIGDKVKVAIQVLKSQGLEVPYN